MLRVVIAAVALLAVAGALAFWAYDRGDDSAEADVEVVRWGNVTVSVPEGSGVIAVPDYALTGERQPVLVLKKGDSFVDLDAQTGEAVQESVADADRAAIDEVLATLEVSEQDIATAPWPYSGDAPAGPRERIGNITYIPPDPASGIVVRTVLADYFDSRGSVLFIDIRNGRSSMGVNTKTGLVDEASMVVAAEDQEAFERWTQAVERVAP